jgi:hypothetical protein
LIGCSNLKDYHPRGEERIRTFDLSSLLYC